MKSESKAEREEFELAIADLDHPLPCSEGAGAL